MGSCLSCKREKPPNTPGYQQIAFETQPRIVIIGAGAAGLSCAVQLKRHGFENVQILECSDRIGGRIWTTRFAGRNVDLGAQWVHGEQNNAIYNMVDTLNLLETSGDLFAHTDWIYANGEVLPRTTKNQLLQAVLRIWHARNLNISDYDSTLVDYMLQQFEAELRKPELQHIDKQIALEFLRTYSKIEGISLEGGIDQVSATMVDTFEICFGSSMLGWRNLGFKEFLQVLIAGNDTHKLGLLENCILFNSRVIRIVWNAFGEPVLICCEDKKTHVADHVVVTVSLGVLKKNKALFDPHLPEPKQRAINFLGFGYICKIFMEFKVPFWKKTWTGFYAMWSAADVESLRKTQFYWIVDIYAFHCMPKKSGLLQGWATGKYIECIETLDNDTLRRGLMKMLKLFLPNVKLTEPRYVLSSKWTIDPAHLGSYSYPSMLTYRHNTGPYGLAQPIYSKKIVESNGMQKVQVHPTLLFAGEATSPNHYSTAHGAVETGIREANRLINFYQSEK